MMPIPWENLKNGKSSIIIKFTNRWIKDIVISCNQDLYGTGMKIHEHLTMNTVSLLRSAQSILGNDNAWVDKCSVYAYNNNRTIKIAKRKDLGGLKPSKDPTFVSPAISSTSVNLSRDRYINSYQRSSYPPPRGRASHYGRGRGDRGNL